MSTIIVAYDRERAIGKENDIPWRGSLPIDMEFFCETTKGATVIMGRRTYESLPETFRPLPGRENIILSMSSRAVLGVIPNDVKVVHSIEGAYAAASHEPYVIGGSSIYSLFLPTVSRIFATEIDCTIEGADTFFPTLPKSEWKQKTHRPFPADEFNAHSGSFVTYERRT